MVDIQNVISITAHWRYKMACFCTGACRRGQICPNTINEGPPEWILGDIKFEPFTDGWKCPVCGRGNAPSKETCDCYHERQAKKEPFWGKLYNETYD